MDFVEKAIESCEQNIRLIDSIIGLYYIPNAASAMRAYGVIGIPAIFNPIRKEVSISIYSPHDFEAAMILASRNKLQTIERRIHGGRTVGQPKSYIVLLNCTPTNITHLVHQILDDTLSRKQFTHNPEQFRDADVLGRTLYEQTIFKNSVLHSTTLLNIVSKIDGGQEDEKEM